MLFQIPYLSSCLHRHQQLHGAVLSFGYGSLFAHGHSSIAMDYSHRFQGKQQALLSGNKLWIECRELRDKLCHLTSEPTVLHAFSVEQSERYTPASCLMKLFVHSFTATSMTCSFEVRSYGTDRAIFRNSLGDTCCGSSKSLGEHKHTGMGALGQSGTRPSPAAHV